MVYNSGILNMFYAAQPNATKSTDGNRRTGKALFEQIQAEGYTGSYSRVTDFIREWRGKAGKTPQGFVPLQFALG